MNAGTTSYTYNSYGELIGQTNANNQTHSMSYDLLGRILSHDGPEGVTSYEYYAYNTETSANKIKKVTGFSGNTEEFTYGVSLKSGANFRHYWTYSHLDTTVRFVPL